MAMKILNTKYLDIYQSIFTKNYNYVKNIKRTSTTRIIKHSTGANNPYVSRYVGTSDEMGVNKYNNDWNKSDKKVCVHYFIGYNKDAKDVVCVQVLPDEIRTNGCGSASKGSYNGYAVQYEICEDSLTNKEYYDKAFALAEKLDAYLLDKYNLSESAVVSHWEAYKLGYANSHIDCDHWMKKFDDTMDKSRARTKKLRTSIANVETPVATTIPLKITSNVKAVQKWANTYYLDCFKDVVGKLDVDGSCGAKTKGAITLILKNELKKLGATDINLKNTNLGSGIKKGLNKYGVVKKGSTGIFVTLAQALLVCKKYDPNGIDGKAGNGFDAAIKKFQKDKKLTQDGSCGAISWTNLLA